MAQITTEDLYRRRFAPNQEFRNAMWKVLCHDFFQQFIPRDATVMEIAAGYCEFTNNIEAARKIAIDINPETARRAAKGVEVILTMSTDLSAVADGTVDVAFTSNFFEHIPREEIVDTMREVFRTLKPGGRFLILQPNIRFAPKDYWMFFDHITPIDDRALCEALEIVGFSIHTNIPRFLPYTAQSRIPKGLGLIKLYLKVPLMWRVLGAQAFVIAEKR